MDGVLLVQLKVVPATEPVKFTAVVIALAHKDWLAGSLTVGIGFTVITVMVEVITVVPALIAVNEAIFPVPEAASPIVVLLLVQL